MTDYSFISLFAAVISFFIANFIYFRNPKNPLNRLIAILSALVSFMAIDEFAYRIVETAGGALLWLKISTFWPLIPSLLLHIALVFTNNQFLKKKWSYLLIYGPAVFFVIIGLSTNFLIGPPILEYWGWTYSIPTSRLIYDIFSIWTVLVSFLAGLLVFLYYFKTEGMEKKESLYISIGLFMPLIFSLVTDFILRELSIKVPEFTQTLLSIGLLFIAYGVWRYNFPLLTPTLAAEKIVSTMPNFLILSDQYGEITKVNESILTNLGYNEKKLIGTPYYMLFVPEKRKLLEKALKKGNCHNLEIQMLSAEGKKLDVVLSVSPIRSILTEPTGYVIIATDLSDIKKAEKQVLETESKFRSVIEQTSDGVSLADSEGKIIYWNQSLENITGLSKKEVMGQYWFDLIYKLMTSEDKEITHYSELKQYFEGIIQKNEIPSHLKIEETEIRRTDDTRRIIQASSFFVEKTYEPLLCSVVSDITQLKEDENQLKLSLKEKEVLLREIHHRVKNNLQIISSLLNIQSRYVKDQYDLDLFKESQNRVKSMAMIHEILYQSKDLASIDFSTYITRLTTELFASYGIKHGQITLKKEIENIELDINTAIPCGLIVNEIITNSIKYAFPDGIQGSINVSFKEINDKYQLIIGDTGIGFPKDINFRNTTSLGMILVNSLVDQLDGNITLDSTSGTCFAIEFKELEYEPRL